MALEAAPSGCAAFEPFLQVLHVPGELCFRLPADDERHEQLADPVPLEVELDSHARPCTVIERLDGAIHDLPDRAPSIPRTAQLLGELSSVVSMVIVRSPRPIRRVVMAFEPTAGGPPPSARALTTLSCTPRAARDRLRTRRHLQGVGRSRCSTRLAPLLLLLLVTLASSRTFRLP